MFFRRKHASKPLFVEDCWTKKKARLNGCRKKRSEQILFSGVETVCTEPVLDVEVCTEPSLNVEVQNEPVLDVVVLNEQLLDVVVQTGPILVVEVQTEALVCVEEVHKPKQPVGRAVDVPSDSEVKKTKSMSELFPVE